MREFTINEKILLVLFPFWTPLIPPLGISCLKSHLKRNGYMVSLADANTNIEIIEQYHNYMVCLKRSMSEYKQGNFINTANHVIRNHMLVHLNCIDEELYLNLVKAIIEKHFYITVKDSLAKELRNIINKIFTNTSLLTNKLINEHNPTIVGISAFTGSLALSLFAARLIKENYHNIITVMGGGVFSDELSLESPNFDSFAKNAAYIDKIIVGEGELLFLKLLQNEFPKEKRIFTLKDIGNATMNISESSIPDFSGLEIDCYPQLAAYVSRSCPYQCSFCSETVQWGRYRRKEPKHIIDELMSLYKEYGSQLFLLGDSLLNPVIDDLANELCKNDTSLYWDGYLRADIHVCDKSKALLWRKGGFYRARIGVESGSQKILDLMDKKITPQQIKSAIRSLASAGIKTTTYWVIGHPEETEEDFKMTLDIISELSDDIYEAECNPFQFFLRGQVNSNKWCKENNIRLLYPKESEKIMITQTWVLNTEPSRDVIFDRICRFTDHCKKLGLPNPYSKMDSYFADERWRRLHKNAVPSMARFMNKNVYIDENKHIL